MALYDENGNQPQTKQARTDYSKLYHNGKTYENLDMMVTQIAKERSHVAFKSTKAIVIALGSKKTDAEIAEAMITTNKQIINEYIQNKDDSRSLFGL